MEGSGADAKGEGEKEEEIEGGVGNTSLLKAGEE